MRCAQDKIVKRKRVERRKYSTEQINKPETLKRPKSGSKFIHEQFPLQRGLKVPYFLLSALPLHDFDLRASHARTLLPAALASVPFGFVLVRVRVQQAKNDSTNFMDLVLKL